MSSVTSFDDNASVRSTNRAAITNTALLYFNHFIKRLIACKSMSQIQTEIETQNKLRRALGWVQLTAIGLGAIIGAGIVELSGQAAAENAGPSVIIAFLITGFVAFLSALSFSELAAMMPSSGAAYTYTYAVFGEYMAWFMGWNYALNYQLSALTVVVSWSNYVVQFINIISNYNASAMLTTAPVVWNEATESFSVTGQAINLPAIAIAAALTLLLISGIRPTAIVNLVLVIFKIIVLLIFIFACCKYVDRDNYTPFIPKNRGSFSQYGVTGMLKACTSVFFAYMGFDSVAAVAQEARPPIGRSIPFATIGSTIISLLIFIGICTVMVGLVPYNLLDSNNPLSVAIKGATPYGRWLLIIIDLGIIAAVTTVALVMLLSQTRIFYAMALDGLLPSVFARVHSRTEAPWISIIISGTFCAVTSGILPVDVVGDIATISALVTYLFVHIEVIVMRRTHADVPRPFQVPCGSWFLPTLGSLLCILLMAGVTKATGIRYLVLTGIGQVVYFSYGFWHSKRRKQARDRESSLKSTQDLLPTVEAIALEHMYHKSEPDLTNEATENEIEDDIIMRF